MASRSINKIMLLGNLTRDPELKYTPAGTAVCTFGVATNRTWTTNDGQTKEDTQFHRIVAWQKLAELCGKLLAKGRKVYLEGRITDREYTDKNGQQRQITEIVLDDFIVFSDGRRPPMQQDNTKDEKTVSADKKPDEKKQEEKPNKEEKKENTEEKSSSVEEKENPADIPF